MVDGLSSSLFDLPAGHLEDYFPSNNLWNFYNFIFSDFQHIFFYIILCYLSYILFIILSFYIFNAIIKQISLQPVGFFLFTLQQFINPELFNTFPKKKNHTQITVMTFSTCMSIDDESKC